MKVEKIREDVWKFKGEGSVFLIKGEKNILIDSGSLSDMENLKIEISKIVPLDEIDAVLLTHLHYDHSGNLTLFPLADIFVDKEELEDYIKDSKKFHFYVNKETDRLMREKAILLPKYIFGLEVLKVPGHTRGSVAFLDNERHLLFSGDTIFGGSISGRTDFHNSLPSKMEESTSLLRKLTAEKGLGLCPGHGYWEDSQ